MSLASIGGLLAGSYLLGSLPFGLWVALKFKGIDIRTVGSGNIGSTNVGRMCGPTAGTIVLILDVCKGLVPPLVGKALHLPSQWFILAAMLAIIGHNYSMFLNFKGGKGIATSAGALLGISPPVCVLAVLVMCLEVLVFRFVSVGSLLAGISLPIGMAIFYPRDHYRLAFAIVACVMAFYKHRANISRLITKSEPRVNLFGKYKTATPDEVAGVTTEVSANQTDKADNYNG